MATPNSLVEIRSAMELAHSQHFSDLSGELCNLLYLKKYDKSRANTVIDELIAKPYHSEFFVHKNDGSTLVTALCLNVHPSDEFLAAKSSHLIINIVTKQNLQFNNDFMWRVIGWHVQCIELCSDVILMDVIHNLQCILSHNPLAATKFAVELIGKDGLLLKFINKPTQNNSQNALGNQDPLFMTLITLKCICSLTGISEECKSADQSNILCTESKEKISQVLIDFLLKISKTSDEFLYCKVVIHSLRVLAQLYFCQQSFSIPLPEVMGICKYFVLYGLIVQGKIEKIMPAQQVVAVPITNNAKGGKKQKLRKQRNNAIESLKKEIPVSDRSLMKDVDSFENNSAYKPINQNYLEPQKTKSGTVWTLTSDSDMSDVDSGKEAKIIALKSRVRQSASNLLLVLVKITDRKDMFGYWWALLPDSPNVLNWPIEESSKRSLAYCAVTDPIASSRTGVLSVVLALLSGSRMYLSQAESSKRETTSFIPFSVSLGYTITCMHKVLVGILDTERVHTVVLVALKCCAALVQATPYHKMNEGLITDLVRSTRKFLVHRDFTLQVGALITIGCVLSIDPKVDEVLRAIEKDFVSIQNSSVEESKCRSSGEDCDDFEEGYSDDEMFTVSENKHVEENHRQIIFNSWILDICFKNMGWTFKADEIVKSKPAAIPIILESLQVLSAIAFHHFNTLLQQHFSLLTDILSDMLQNDHQEVILQSARTVSVIGDAIQKLDALEQSPPLHECVYFWEKLLIPLSAVLQCQDNPSAKAVVCDCIANIGEKSFKKLPRKLQMLCCALLVGSCSDDEPSVRAAAVRALAMAVMYRTLREDICFVSDCGENVLRALSEQTLVVRTKAAWALGNLSDALVLNMDDLEIDDIDDDLLLRLLEVSIQCAADNDKIKMSATRGLGNLLRLIKNENLLRNPRIRTLCESAIEKLLDCASTVTNMKVRWNACYAMGNAMKNCNLFTCFSQWQKPVFSSLCKLAQDCKNLKVRINAVVALRAPQTRAHYGELFTVIWQSVMAAMENAAHVDDYTEYKHKDNLIEQLCVTLAHLCCLLSTSDLLDILDALSFHYDIAKSFLAQLCHKLPPENTSCLRILEAAKYVTIDLTATTESQQQSLRMLQDIFIWDL